jgi:hypothetical protein
MYKKVNFQKIQGVGMMTYQVKKNIVSLVSTVLIFGLYSFFVLQAYQDRAMDVADYAEVFVFFATAIVILIPINILASITIHILFTIINRIAANEEEPAFADELDKLIELKALRNGYFIFIIGFAIAMLAIVFGLSPTTMFLVLYVSGFISGISVNITSLYLYSKGV